MKMNVPFTAVRSTPETRLWRFCHMTSTKDQGKVTKQWKKGFVTCTILFDLR